jgi:hypothetical protein
MGFISPHSVTKRGLARNNSASHRTVSHTVNSVQKPAKKENVLFVIR